MITFGQSGTRLGKSIRGTDIQGRWAGMLCPYKTLKAWGTFVTSLTPPTRTAWYVQRQIVDNFTAEFSITKESPGYQSTGFSFTQKWSAVTNDGLTNTMAIDSHNLDGAGKTCNFPRFNADSVGIEACPNEGLGYRPISFGLLGAQLYLPDNGRDYSPNGNAGTPISTGGLPAGYIWALKRGIWKFDFVNAFIAKYITDVTGPIPFFTSVYPLRQNAPFPTVIDTRNIGGSTTEPGSIFTLSGIQLLNTCEWMFAIALGTGSSFYLPGLVFHFRVNGTCRPTLGSPLSRIAIDSVPGFGIDQRPDKIDENIKRPGIDQVNEYPIDESPEEGIDNL